MLLRSSALGVLGAATITMVTFAAADVSRQQADSFARKIIAIEQRSSAPPAAERGRTPITEGELNSWFTYRAQPLLPQGVTAPRLTIIGNGKVVGGATVDLESIGKKRASGGSFDPWSYLGGRVPVTVTGILHTQDGRGRFELQSADVSGVPVPKMLLQELVSYYSRTPTHPDGVRLDDAFSLPANIQKIEVGEGQAVVVQ